VQQDGATYIEIPEQEMALGGIDAGDVYRIAILEAQEESGNEESVSSQNAPTPPVEVGDERTVDIEDIGEQGDGIARVERGYVIIVPDTEQGERVTIKITDVRENLGFGEVLEREDYYE